MKQLILLFITLILCGCASTKVVEVPVEVIKNNYINTTDSVYIHDSIYHEVVTKGDTVYNTKIKYKVIKEHSTDTVIKIDSIPYPVKVTETVVTNKLKDWQKLLMTIGGVVVLGLFISGGLKLYKIIK